MLRRVGLATVVMAACALATPAQAARDDGGRLDRVLGVVPERLVTGTVFLKIDGLGQPLLVAATRGDARAQQAVDAALERVATETGVSVVFSHALPVGWASYRVDAASEDDTLAIARALRGRAGVLDSDVDWWKRALRTPNDGYYSYQWMIDHIGGEAAWDMTTGLTSSRVGVIDTGTIRGHEDLGGKDLAGFDFISYTDISNDGDGRDSQYEDAGDDDNSYHGTHVAGTILANGNNGTGITGVSWGARLITGRALGFGGGSNDDIMTALAWMAGDSGSEAGTLPSGSRPRVVNMSLGAANTCSSFEQEVINWVINQGVIIVAAAGNDGGGVNSPANCQNVVAVAATDAYGSLATYSSFGSQIDVVAPGGEMVSDYDEGVLSLYAALNGEPPYTFYQGTSMAAPHVAGVVSLMLDINPSLDTADVISIFATTGTESCSYCDGKPFLRADLALVEAGGIPPEEPPPEEPPPEEPPPEEPPPNNGPGGGSGGAECDPNRGNLDCPDRQGCLPSSDSALGGTCIVGVDGEIGIGGLCEDDDECGTGLCVKGVCSTACDEDGDCRDGYDCDEDAIPGGLCEPESCLDEDEDFCESDWSCQYSPSENYVCAAGESNYFSCAQPGDGAWPLGALASLLGLARLRRRSSRP